MGKDHGDWYSSGYAAKGGGKGKGEKGKQPPGQGKKGWLLDFDGEKARQGHGVFLGALP